MKIAFLSFYSGHVYRGVETYVHELCNRLAVNHNVIVYQSGPKLPDAKYTTITVNISVDFKRHTESSISPNYYYIAFKLKRFTEGVLKLLDKEVDVIVPTNGGWQAFLCRAWSFIHGRRMVIPGQAGPGFADRMNLLTFPTVFVGLTDYQCSWARKVNPFVRVDKIPNGVDLNKFSDIDTKLELDLPRPVILCAAALVQMKRLHLAIKSVAGLEKGSLVLVGRGEKERELSDLGKKLLPGRFKILSFPYSEMPKIYRSADLFTFPTSCWESFGIAMVEAMASGLPVVASDDPIRREIVGGAGLFVDPTDTQAYTAALQKALDTKWGNRPRKQAEKFSWDDIARQYEKLFLSLTQKSKV